MALSREGDNVGVERAVTRWYALRQTLAEEIVRLEMQVAQPPDQESSTDESIEGLREQLTRAQERLRLLGPCPRPMMG